MIREILMTNNVKCNESFEVDDMGIYSNSNIYSNYSQIFIIPTISIMHIKFKNKNNLLKVIIHLKF